MKNNNDDQYLYAKVDDAVSLSYKRDFPCFVGFLNEHQAALLQNYCMQMKINHTFYGGYAESERLMLGVCSLAEQIDFYYFPISTISFLFKDSYTLTHRDVLGALMAKGVKRETIGDILTEPGRAVAFVKEEINEYLFTQIDKIGSVGVTCSKEEPKVLPSAHSFKQCECTVASMRLDNIVSAITGLSRDVSQKTIKSGLVYINALAVYSITAKINCGDKISVRGKGKYIVSAVNGETRKGRKKLIINEYR